MESLPQAAHQHVTAPPSSSQKLQTINSPTFVSIIWPDLLQRVKSTQIQKNEEALSKTLKTSPVIS